MTQSKSIKLLSRLQEKACKKNKVGKYTIERIRDAVNNPAKEKHISKMIEDDFPHMHPEDRRKIKEWMFTKWQELFKVMPTPYEEPFSYALIVDLAKDIEAAIRDLSLSEPPHPIIGTLPVSCVNAISIAVPSSDEYLIIFSTGLFEFFSRMSLIITKALPFMGDKIEGVHSINPKLVEQHIESNPEVIEQFYKTLYSYLVLGDMGFTEPWDINTFEKNFSFGIKETMGLFIMGHEYGHIINGHNSHCTAVTSKINTESVNKLVLTHMQEYEADWTGALLTLKAMNAKHQNLTWSCLGFSFFFTCYEMLVNGISILKTREMDNYQFNTHPPPAYRRTRLWEGLYKSQTLKLPISALDSAMRKAEKLHINMNQLWIRITPRLRKLHDDGVRPAEKWS